MNHDNEHFNVGQCRVPRDVFAGIEELHINSEEWWPASDPGISDMTPSPVYWQRCVVTDGGCGFRWFSFEPAHRHCPMCGHSPVVPGEVGDDGRNVPAMYSVCRGEYREASALLDGAD